MFGEEEWRGSEEERRTSNIELRTSNVEPKKPKRERRAVLSVPFTSSVRCSKFGVQCSMFVFILQTFNVRSSPFPFGVRRSHSFVIHYCSAMRCRASRDIERLRRSTEILPSMPNIDEFGIVATIPRRISEDTFNPLSGKSSSSAAITSSKPTHSCCSLELSAQTK